MLSIWKLRNLKPSWTKLFATYKVYLLPRRKLSTANQKLLIWFWDWTKLCIAFIVKSWRKRSKLHRAVQKVHGKNEKMMHNNWNKTNINKNKWGKIITLDINSNIVTSTIKMMILNSMIIIHIIKIIIEINKRIVIFRIMMMDINITKTTITFNQLFTLLCFWLWSWL